jgi:hypothetical protein
MKILVAGWDSGGGVEAVQTVVRRTVARGHNVRVLGTEGLRSRFESAGAMFRRYKYAPDNDLRRPETDLVKDWETRNPLTLWASALRCDAPSRAEARACPTGCAGRRAESGFGWHGRQRQVCGDSRALGWHGPDFELAVESGQPVGHIALA